MATSSSPTSPSTTDDLLAKQTANLAALTTILKDIMEVVARDALQPDVEITNNIGGRPVSQQSAAERTWQELSSTGTLFLESDYRIFKQGLGRPDEDMYLQVVPGKQFVAVTGSGVAETVALVINRRVVLPVDRLGTTCRVRLSDLFPQITPEYLQADPLVTVLTFNSRRVTGSFVGRVSSIFDVTDSEILNLIDAEKGLV
jgi:hypothetical protein